jgi:hypothetical protein
MLIGLVETAKQPQWRLVGEMLNIRFEQAVVIEPMQAAQVSSFMNSWWDTIARTEDRAGTARLCPKSNYSDASQTAASQRYAKTPVMRSSPSE